VCNTAKLGSFAHKHNSQDSHTWPIAYRFLAHSGTYIISNVDDKADFAVVEKALLSIGIDAKEQEWLWGILTTLLQLGNVEFSADGGGSTTSKAGAAALKKAAASLKIDLAVLQHCLTNRTVRAGGEGIEVHLPVHEATAARDSMAKCVTIVRVFVGVTRRRCRKPLFSHVWRLYCHPETLSTRASQVHLQPRVRVVGEANQRFSSTRCRRSLFYWHP
jgi:myosin heavy subunit